MSYFLSGAIHSDTGKMLLMPVGGTPYYNSGSYTDEAEIVNGKFIFHGQITYPHAFRLGLKINAHWKYISDVFFVEPTTQTIFCHIDSAREIPKIENKTMVELRNNYLAEKKNTGTSGDFICGYIKTHPNSYVAMWKLIDAFNLSNTALFDSCFAHFSNKMQNTYTGKILREKLLAARKTMIGATFPQLLFLNLHNKKTSIVFATSRYVFIDFWSSHCGPCIGQFAALKNIYSLFRGKGFTIVGVSIDLKADQDAWQSAITKNKLPWPQYWDVDAKEASKLGINALPQNILIDGKGKILANNLAPEQLQDFLKTHL